MFHLLLGTVTVVNTYPYLEASLITAVPATAAAILSWHAAHRGRKDNAVDVGKQNVHFDNQFEKIGLQFQRMDLRFDGIEDTVERHLDWHRVRAEDDLPDLIKEHTSVINPNTHPGT